MKILIKSKKLMIVKIIIISIINIANDIGITNTIKSLCADI